uniref:Protoporphyrinogen oxidase n=1 Tax=Strigomonas oncopelti TaxID=5657 RepID=G1C9P2_STROO|nr:protoporphyrinogen oxidase [Strigomonas oncopelti]
MKYLIVFSTTDGHTKVIADAIADTIRSKDNAAECTVQDIKVLTAHKTPTAEVAADIKNYDKFVLGASIRYGYFSEEVSEFVKQNHSHLNSIPTGFFSVNMTARKANKRSPETNPYTRKFLSSCPWRPTKAAVFAGALYYPRYSFFDRNMIRFIMKLTGGDTDPKTEKVYTDWDSVKAFAGEVVAMTTSDIPAAQERAANLHKMQEQQERTRRLYRLCFVGGVAAVVAITRIATLKRLQKHD